MLEPLVVMQDSVAGIPIFVFLSPGVDVAASVEALGRKVGFTADNGRYAVVSLGQGQEPIAMAQLTQARAAGGWVLLQNIHLTIDWTAGPLEKAVDKLAVGGHSDFRRALRPACGCMAGQLWHSAPQFLKPEILQNRLFLSAEPPPLLERALPISLLQNSIKLTNEPPEGLKVPVICTTSACNACRENVMTQPSIADPDRGRPTCGARTASSARSSWRAAPSRPSSAPSCSRCPTSTPRCWSARSSASATCPAPPPARSHAILISSGPRPAASGWL